MGRLAAKVAALVVAIAGTQVNPAAEVPSFEAFPSAANTGTLSPVPVDVSGDPRARRFKSVLASAASSGPNFAGHFTIATWGCGVACQEIAVIDASTGRVYFSKHLKLNAYQAVTDGTEPFDFHLNSRLLVLSGSPNDGDETGSFYYEWTGSDFRLITKTIRAWAK